MKDKELCPVCGFLSHPSHSKGNETTYVCERCRAVFIKTN